MGKASRRKWESRIADLRNSLSKLYQNQNTRLPWYENPTAQWLIGLGAAFILATVAAKVRDLRWLLWPAWGCFVLASYPISRNISSRQLRIISMVLIILSTGYGLFKMNALLEPIQSPNDKEILITTWLKNTGHLVCKQKNPSAHFDLEIMNINRDPGFVTYFKDGHQQIQIYVEIVVRDDARKTLNMSQKREGVELINTIQTELFKIPLVGFEGVTFPLPEKMRIYSVILKDSSLNESDFLVKLDAVFRARRIVMGFVAMKANQLEKKLVVEQGSIAC